MAPESLLDTSSVLSMSSLGTCSVPSKRERCLLDTEAQLPTLGEHLNVVYKAPLGMAPGLAGELIGPILLGELTGPILHYKMGELNTWPHFGSHIGMA